MPEENKITKEDPKVDIDTSGPEMDVLLPEEKKEEVKKEIQINYRFIEIKKYCVENIGKDTLKV